MDLTKGKPKPKCGRRSSKLSKQGSANGSAPTTEMRAGAC